MLIEEAYFGWDQLTHTTTCTSPTAGWEIDVRHDTGAHPLGQPGTTRHGCPLEDCGHGDTFDRVTVRAICRSCGTAHLITGAGLTRQTTTTEAIGYGQPPRKVAGLYLWPSRPVLYGWGPGKSGQDDKPHEYLATTELVDCLTPEDCVGAIGRHRTDRGALRWWAAASPVPPPPRLAGQVHRLAWGRRTTDHTSPEQAAAWIAAAIDPAQQQPLVVAV
ncbi:hypothetical protein [Streptomyces sp. NPDC002845]